MDRIDVDGLKAIQLDILKAVHVFCQTNGIQYSLSSGTLIGAVRHKGYIPWDDDIDICLLREDYIKLEKAFPSLLDGKYEFLSLARNRKWDRPWGKIHDTRTLLNENARHSMKGMGIGIDVFIMDDVPDDFTLFSRWNKMRVFLVYLWVLKALRLDRERGFFKNTIVLCSRILLLPFSHRRLALAIDSFIQRPNGKGFARVFESCDSLKALSNQQKSNFDSYTELEFEGLCFCVMGGYDDYLHSIYGDYMQLPPVEQRVSHHTFNAYWK